MGKLPYMQWFPGDWKKDRAVLMLTPLARGIWREWLDAMFTDDRAYKITGTPEQLAGPGLCTPADAMHAIQALQSSGAADVHESCGVYTIVSRRFQREAKERKQAANRALTKRRRDRNANVTLASRPNPEYEGEVESVVLSLKDLETEARKTINAGARENCAPMVLPEDPMKTALMAWSTAARIGWNSACDNAVAAWWMQTLPMLSLPPDPPDALERIVAALRRKGTDFRSVKFALACVRSAVEEWTRTGVPPWVVAPSGGGKVAETPKERAARLVAARQNGTHA